MKGKEKGEISSPRKTSRFIHQEDRGGHEKLGMKKGVRVL